MRLLVVDTQDAFFAFEFNQHFVFADLKHFDASELAADGEHASVDDCQNLIPAHCGAGEGEFGPFVFCDLFGSRFWSRLRSRFRSRGGGNRWSQCRLHDGRFRCFDFFQRFIGCRLVYNEVDAAADDQQNQDNRCREDDEKFSGG